LRHDIAIPPAASRCDRREINWENAHDTKVSYKFTIKVKLRNIDSAIFQEKKYSIPIPISIPFHFSSFSSYYENGENGETTILIVVSYSVTKRTVQSASKKRNRHANSNSNDPIASNPMYFCPVLLSL
jgi:hypothetical protein